MPTHETRTTPASAAARPKGPRRLVHAVLDRALRGVRKELRRVERRTAKLEATTADLEATTADLGSIRASVAQLADALAAAEAGRASDHADFVRRTGELTRALVEGSRAGDRAAVVEPVIDAVIDRRLTQLGRPMLRDLADLALEADATGLPGILVETGCSKGGSALVLTVAKAPERLLRVYDVFGTIPPPGDGHAPDGDAPDGDAPGRDAPGRDAPGGDAPGDVLAGIRRAFDDLGLVPETSAVSFVQGLFADTLHVEEPIAVAHLDGDRYESTMVCLERLGPRIVPGGRIVLNDYDFWEGCCRAVDEWLAGHPEFEKERRSRLHLVRGAG